jgi:hypothetical protein
MGWVNAWHHVMKKGQEFMAGLKAIAPCFQDFSGFRVSGITIYPIP